MNGARAHVEPKKIIGGLKVEVVFRKVKEDGKDGIIQYGYKFRLIIE